jgi:hypothetical protein
MPMMPGMPGGGGAPGSQNQNERPDSAGLLGGVKEPWETTAPHSSSGELGSPAGAAAGGPGLSELLPQHAVDGNGLPLPEATVPDGAPAGLGGLPGMPMMPGMPGGGAPGAQQQNERPDSAGLLGGVTDPWSADENGSEESDPGSSTGAAAGGPGLSGPVPMPFPGVMGEAASEESAGKKSKRTETDIPTDAEAEAPESAAISAAPAAPAAHAVPVLAQPGVEDHSAWEVAGSGAAALLGLTGLARGEGQDDRDLDTRIVSTERDAWLDDEAAVTPVAAHDSAAPEDEQSGLAVWRRPAGGTAAPSAPQAQVRSGMFPPGYVPPEPEEAAEEEPEEEAEEETGTSSAKLLVQESSTWGSDAPDWGELE